MKNALKTEIFPYLPENVRQLLAVIEQTILDNVVEVRLRVNQPLLLVLPGRDYYVTINGSVSVEDKQAYFCTNTDINQVVQAISRNSLYALEEELRRGYITLEGGHRIGLTGQAVLEDGVVRTLKNFNALNIRLAREVKGCGNKVLPYLFDKNNILRNTLLVSPPRCGKTTLLRDLVRSLSTGSEFSPGIQVAVVDERSEIAASKQGKITNDLGLRVDVLDGCPKASGMLMLIRTMAPQVIITDEIGRSEDITAMEEALHAGVRVIATVHGNNLTDLYNRPQLKLLIQQQYFDCYVFLTDKPKIGTIREIYLVKEGEKIHVC